MSPASPTVPAPVKRTPLGIDIAKRSFDAVVLLPNGKRRHRKFENHPTGFQALLAWLQQLGVTQWHACLEATGTYWEARATFLYDQDHAKSAVSVVNPKRIAHFAKSRMARAKTDQVDAALIASFCAQEGAQLLLGRPPAPMYRELQALLRRRVALEQAQQQERHRLGAGLQAAFVEQSLRQHLDYLASALQEVEAAIAKHLAAHPELRAQRERLLTIPGIGLTTALWLLAELGDVQRFRRGRQAAAYAGLGPTRGAVRHVERSDPSLQARERSLAEGVVPAGRRLPPLEPAAPGVCRAATGAREVADGRGGGGAAQAHAPSVRSAAPGPGV